MNNKLLSALVAIVMITSVCVIPVSSDDGYAAEGDPVLKDGDAYGIYLDLNDNTINKLFSDLTESEMNSADVKSFIAALTQTLDKNKELLSNFGIDIGIILFVNTSGVKIIIDCQFRVFRTQVYPPFKILNIG